MSTPIERVNRVRFMSIQDRLDTPRYATQSQIKASEIVYRTIPTEPESEPIPRPKPKPHKALRSYPINKKRYAPPYQLYTPTKLDHTAKSNAIIWGVTACVTPPIMASTLAFDPSGLSALGASGIMSGIAGYTSSYV